MVVKEHFGRTFLGGHFANLSFLDVEIFHWIMEHLNRQHECLHTIESEIYTIIVELFSLNQHNQSIQEEARMTKQLVNRP